MPNKPSGDHGNNKALAVFRPWKQPLRAVLELILLIDFLRSVGIHPPHLAVRSKSVSTDHLHIDPLDLPCRSGGLGTGERWGLGAGVDLGDGAPKPRSCRHCESRDY